METELILYAAESLKEAFAGLIPAFEKEHGCRVKAVWGPSGALRHDIEGLMPCDVFCSADRENPAALNLSGKAMDLFSFARNRMIVVTKDERRFLNSDWLTLLCDPSIAIGTSTPVVSPEGDWARKLFQNTGKAYPKKIGSKIIAQHSVPLIGGNRTDENLEGETGAHFILRHGVDAAVVYGSWKDRILKEGLRVYEIAPEAQPEITYWGCFGRTGKAPSALTKAFREYLLSPAAQAALRAAGFREAAE